MDEPQKPPTLCETCGKPLAGPVERLLAETLTGGIAFPAEPLQPEEVRPGYLRCEFQMWHIRFVFEAIEARPYDEVNITTARHRGNDQLWHRKNLPDQPSIGPLPNRAGLWLVTITPAEEA